MKYIPSLNKKQILLLLSIIVLMIGIGILGSLLPHWNGTDNTETYLAGYRRFNAEPLPEAQPVSLSIPAIDINASFGEAVGLDAKGEIEVQESFTDVAWYKYGPTPGEIGPAIVLGHVDSETGPAVFYSLGQLSKGDEITITREDDTKAIFEVDTLERYSQDLFPTEKVYGEIDYPGLRLITCSGTYNRETKRYDKNLVVYAYLVGQE